MIKHTEKPTLTPTKIDFPSAPEPHGPIIKGTISGLPEGLFATISARLTSEKEGGEIGFRENGNWEMEVIYDENVQRSVIAEAV